LRKGGILKPCPLCRKGELPPLERGIEGDLMRIVLNNNINNNLDVYFQRKLKKVNGEK